MQLADLTALRGLPEVEAATPVTWFLLRHEHAQKALGLALVDLAINTAILRSFELARRASLVPPVVATRGC